MPSRTFRDKIDKVQEITGLSPSAMELKTGLGQGTVTKKYRANEEMSPNSTRIFLGELHINREWWESGKGEVLEKIHTPVDKKDMNSEKPPEQIYRDLVESNSDYRLVPKSILNEEYRIILKTEIDEKSLLLKDALKTRDALIEQLRREIKLLEERLSSMPKTSKQT